MTSRPISGWTPPCATPGTRSHSPPRSPSRPWSSKRGWSSGGCPRTSGRTTASGGGVNCSGPSARSHRTGRRVRRSGGRGADLLLLSTTTAPLGRHVREAAGMPSSAAWPPGRGDASAGSPYTPCGGPGCAAYCKRAAPGSLPTPATLRQCCRWPFAGGRTPGGDIESGQHPLCVPSPGRTRGPHGVLPAARRPEAPPCPSRALPGLTRDPLARGRGRAYQRVLRAVVMLRGWPRASRVWRSPSACCNAPAALVALRSDPVQRFNGF